MSRTKCESQVGWFKQTYTINESTRTLKLQTLRQAENLGEEEATRILQQWLIDPSRCLQDDTSSVEVILILL